MHDEQPTSDEARDPRAPYAPPLIESGDAFERIQLNSGCNSAVFNGCEIPCD
jgi:hypothetical protein